MLPPNIDEEDIIVLTLLLIPLLFQLNVFRSALFILSKIPLEIRPRKKVLTSFYSVNATSAIDFLRILVSPSLAMSFGAEPPSFPYSTSSPRDDYAPPPPAPAPHHTITTREGLVEELPLLIFFIIPVFTWLFLTFFSIIFHLCYRLICHLRCKFRTIQLELVIVVKKKKEKGPTEEELLRFSSYSTRGARRDNNGSDIMRSQLGDDDSSPRSSASDDDSPTWRRGAGGGANKGKSTISLTSFSSMAPLPESPPSCPPFRPHVSSLASVGSSSRRRRGSEDESGRSSCFAPFVSIYTNSKLSMTQVSFSFKDSFARGVKYSP